MRLPSRGRRLTAAALGLMLAACANPGGGDSAAPAIVLVTCEGLRPDALAAFGGPPKLAPALDRFAAEADWTGIAIAASGSPGPALVSLLTGLPPHQHRSWSGRPRLHAELDSLAEGLRRVSYRTAAYREGDLVRRQMSLARGFDAYESAASPQRVMAALRTLRPASDFLWLHSSLPGGEPLVLRERFRARLGLAGESLPRKLRTGDVGSSEAERAAAEALYRSNVAQADLELGERLDELRRDGPWTQAAVLVVGVNGWSADQDEPREGGLERAELEVPLLVKLPKKSPLRIQPAHGTRVSALRIYATLLELAGATPVPAAAPSLFHTAAGGALSERFAGNGINEFSLVDGDRRLLRTVRFAPAEPEYEAARSRSRAKSRERSDLSEPARRILRRLHRAFLRTPPFEGLSASLTLEAWHQDGSVTPLDDPAAAARLSAELDRAYHAFLEQEGAPSRDEAAAAE